MTGRTSLQEEALRIFGGLSESYDFVLDYATLLQDRRWKDWVVRSAGLRRGMRVLDIGCGTCLLERQLRTDSFLVGLDISKEMLTVAQNSLPQSVASVLLSDGEVLPFRDESFDVVLSCYVVKYCDERDLVSETARVLRPGGRFVLYDFVRPRGAFWPLNALYAYGGLRVIGKLLAMSHSDAAYTFSSLPGIIARSTWETDFRHVLERHGFDSVKETLLPGGVAVGFQAERPRT